MYKYKKYPCRYCGVKTPGMVCSHCTTKLRLIRQILRMVRG